MGLGGSSAGCGQVSVRRLFRAPFTLRGGDAHLGGLTRLGRRADAEPAPGKSAEPRSRGDARPSRCSIRLRSTAGGLPHRPEFPREGSNLLAAYVSGHGFGHATRLSEVLRILRSRAPSIEIEVSGEAPEELFQEAARGPTTFRRLRCDVGLAQRDALEIDLAATAARCREFEAGFAERVASEAAHLRLRGARLVVGDIPPLAFAAAARAGVPSVALGNFSWDWIYRHLSASEPSLARSADLAAQAYAGADLILELPFAGDLSAFRTRVPVGLVARRPRLAREEARLRLGLGSETAVLVSFGGVGLPSLTPEVLARNAGLRFLLPADLSRERLLALGLSYPDVIGAADAVVTKPGYGIVSDAIGAGARLVYSDRGDFPEYPVLVREMPAYLACVHVPREELLAGRLSGPVREVLSLAAPGPTDLGGAERAAARLLEALG